MMPVPAPWIFHVPELSVCVPTVAGLPMSLQLHPDGQGFVGGTAAGVLLMAPMVIALNVKVADVPLLSDVAVRPVMTSAGMANVVVLPWMSV
jgi:hypothetical protein